MEQFPGNSQNPTAKPAKPAKDIQPVVTGEVIQKPKSIGRKFKALFSGGDIRQAGRYIVADVAVPALKNMFADAGKGFIDRMIYGQNAPRRGASSYGPRTSYNSPNLLTRMTQPAMLPQQPPLYGRTRRQEMGDIVLASREEAELVLENLSDIIKQYDVASVADLYELLNITSASVDHKWGWAVLSHAKVSQVREGFLIDLPPAQPIDN